jgi:hypothetical protein
VKRLWLVKSRALAKREETKREESLQLVKSRELAKREERSPHLVTKIQHLETKEEILQLAKSC